MKSTLTLLFAVIFSPLLSSTALSSSDSGLSYLSVAQCEGTGDATGLISLEFFYHTDLDAPRKISGLVVSNIFISRTEGEGLIHLRPAFVTPAYALDDTHIVFQIQSTEITLIHGDPSPFTLDGVSYRCSRTEWSPY